ncbi:hypothetical protein [Paenibacillus sp. J2TS4]|uniref:hypothetical protein n=1 Tax=Paenibacillus sp. J2TS4 TaxID=2807194 RepID=UPI001B10065F|nr:hypothetical protein [Paenibacillus sp. J2TS4]GIP35504.1 hypothetical protein J2TS4_47140 [Paenibacillus sp. J2TS4]
MAKKNQAKGYTKQQFLQSDRYSPVHKNVLDALLTEDETYTTDQVAKKVEQFMKKEAK